MSSEKVINEMKAIFGLSSNSTLLSALLTAGQVASRSYSWWWGLNGASLQIDGSIVFGGYDAAKTIAPNYSTSLQPSTGHCQGGMYVEVLNMTLDFPNGTISALMTSASPGPFTACLQPDEPVVMALHEDPYFNVFQDLVQTPYIGREANPSFGFWGMLYEPNDVYAHSELR